MKNKTFNLRQARDFGDLVQDSLQFVLVNFKTYLNALVLYVGPIYLVVSIIQAMFLKDLQEMIQELTANAMSNPENMTEALMEMAQGLSGQGIMGPILISSIVSIVASLILTAVTIGIVVTYRQNPGAEISMTAIREKISTFFLPYLGLMVVSILLFLGLYIGGILLVVASAAVYKGLTVIVVIALAFVMIYSVIVLMLTYPILMEENLGPVASIKRAFQLIKGHWWQTFGVILVLSLIYLVASIILGAVIGIFFSLMGEFGSSTTMVAVSTLITTLVGGLFSSLVLTGMAFQYYNLHEEKDSFSPESRIDDIGREEEEEKGDFF